MARTFRKIVLDTALGREILSRAESVADKPKYSLPTRSQKHRTYGQEQALSLWRGGTSKGLFMTEGLIRTFSPDSITRTAYGRSPLPRPSMTHRSSEWNEVHKRIAELLGSPDVTQRQLNGLGGGISSLSKAVVLHHPVLTPEPPSLPQVEYTFLQVGVDDGVADMSGNCGNLTAAVGPYAVEMSLLVDQLRQHSILDLTRGIRINTQDRLYRYAVPATVELWNRNTDKIIRSTFWVSLDQRSSQERWNFEPRGNFEMPGVPGTGSEIRLQWLRPGGSKTTSTLPTGSASESVNVNGRTFAVSLVDVSNPGIFVDGRELGWDPSRKPTELDDNADLMATLDEIRQAGTKKMGLDPNKPSVPKIVMVFPSNSDDRHIDCQALSMGKAHKAVPGTLAMNLAAACQIPGTVPNMLARTANDGMVTIGHPTGTATIRAKVDGSNVDYVEISRTARCLMRGTAYGMPNNYECVPMKDEQIERLKKTRQS